MARQIPRECFALVDGTTALRLPDFPRASCPLAERPDYARGPRRRSRVTLQALESLAPLPPEIAELRSDFMDRDAEHADMQPLCVEGTRPHDLFDLSGELELPSNDNRPKPARYTVGELERVMSFELSKVSVNTQLPRELAELREDLEMLFPSELLGLSR